jgi:APA family basic amino acid/polyamine antiporter
VIILGALMGMISSLLVFQYGQTRIWFAMSRDGLLPGFFSTLHKTFKTPHWSTWIAGFLVGLPAGIVDIGQAADLSNIGTLFAFVLVSLGVIFLRRSQPDRQRAVPDYLRHPLRWPDGWFAGRDVDAFLHMAGCRVGHLFRL